ncbi:MAG TPA: T9SS type A sorting domain-containing protein, partial [Sphingobacteriaceae bacterium]
KGNTVIRNLPIHVDFSGEVGLRESIDGPIHPGAFYNFVLDYGIVKSGLDFLCARTSLPNDVAMEDNVICTDFDNETSIFRAYPNPAIGHLNVEWVSPVDENIVIALIDAMGKEVSRIGRTSAKGFNSELLDVSRLNGGLFMLVIKTPGKFESQKIFIRGN